LLRAPIARSVRRSGCAQILGTGRFWHGGDCDKKAPMEAGASIGAEHGRADALPLP